MADDKVSSRVYIAVGLMTAFIGGCAIIIGALISSGQLRLQFDSQGSSPTATTAPTVTAMPTVTTVPVNGLQYGPDQEKCQWLLTNFPQSEEAMRLRFNLPSDSSVTLVTEFCRDEVVNGFILEGRTEIEVQVPNGGCIDSDTDSYFSDTPQPESWGGLRATSGVVRAEGMTYRAAWCERIP